MHQDEVTRTFALLPAALLLVMALERAGPAQTVAVTPAKQAIAIPIFATPPDAKPPRSLSGAMSFGPIAPAVAVAFSPDGKLLASGGYQEVLLWDLANAKLLARLGTGQLADVIHALAFRNNGQLLAVAEGAPHGQGAVKLFEIPSGKLVAALAEPKDATYNLAFSPDGKLVAAGGVDTVVRIWNVDEKKLAGEIKEHGDWVLGVAFSADGKLLATVSADKTVLVWETGSWKRVGRLEEPDPAQAAAFSPDGQMVVVAEAGVENKLLRIRRWDNGQLVRQIDLGAAIPLDVLWHPQGNRLYVPLSDNTVRVYDAGNGAHVATLAGHSQWVHRVALTADSGKLASASADGTVKLWVPGESRLVATLAQLTPRTDEWLIFTPPGYMATSTPAAVQWNAVGVQTPPNKLIEILQNVELLKQTLAGNKTAAPAIP